MDHEIDVSRETALNLQAMLERELRIQMPSALFRDGKTHGVLLSKGPRLVGIGRLGGEVEIDVYRTSPDDPWQVHFDFWYAFPEEDWQWYWGEASLFLPHDDVEAQAAVISWIGLWLRKEWSDKQILARIAEAQGVPAPTPDLSDVEFPDGLEMDDVNLI